MELNFERHENFIVVYLHGRFDVYYSEKFEKAILKLMNDETPCHLIFNLRNVEYLSSSGIGLLVSVMVRQKKREKMLILCDLPGAVKKILDLVEMTAIFNIYKSEADARDFLNR